MSHPFTDPWASLRGLTRTAVKERQSRLLRRFIERVVYPFSPFYRRLFDEHGLKPSHIRGVEDLSRIPMISKNDFLVEPVNGEDPLLAFCLQPTPQRLAALPLSQKAVLMMRSLRYGRERIKQQLEWEYRPIFITFTTGTTARPAPFLYTAYDIRNLEQSGRRMLRLFQVTPTDKVLNLFPYAPHLAFWQVVFGGLASGIFVMSTGGGRVLGTQGNINAIDKIKPSVLIGVPEYVYHVVRSALEQDKRWDGITTVILGASACTTQFKTKLAALLQRLGSEKVRILGTYGFTEARCAWGECANDADPLGSTGYHLYPDREIFEIIDPQTGQSLPDDADGEIVYTALDARGSVVLRYRTGDFVEGGIRYDPCPACGLTVPRLSSRIRRLSDNKTMNLTKIKGTLVNLQHFADVLSSLPYIEEWQVCIQKKNNDPHEIDELHVYVALRGAHHDPKIIEDINQALSHATEVRANEIHVLSLDELIKRLELENANKAKRILDLRPKKV